MNRCQEVAPAVAVVSHQSLVTQLSGFASLLAALIPQRIPKHMPDHHVAGL